MILVEGKDLKFLKEFQDTLFPDSRDPFQGLPNMSIGGWSGWKLAVGTSMGFHNALGEDIRTYCILDSDYHSPQEINDRYREAQQRDVQLHIWQHKEIENYLFNPKVISRVIAKRVAKRMTPPTSDEIRRKLEDLASALKDDILDSMATEYWASNRNLGQAGANKAARKRIRDVQQQYGSLIPLVPGKKVLGPLANWSNTEFGVSFSPMNVAREMTAYEIPPEMFLIINAIEKGESFPGEPTTS